MTISTAAEKAFDKTQYFFMRKMLTSVKKQDNRPKMESLMLSLMSPN